MIRMLRRKADHFGWRRLLFQRGAGCEEVGVIVAAHSEWPIVDCLYVFLVFTLLYPPCVAAIGAVKSELGARYAVAVFAFQVTVAWIVAFVVHSAGILLGLA